MAFNPVFHSSFDIFTGAAEDWTFNTNFFLGPALGPGRFGGHCYNFSNTGFGFASIERAIGGNSGYWFHFAYRQYTDPSGAFGSNIPVFQILKPSTSLVLLTLNTRNDGKLDCIHGATTITTTAVFNFGNVSTPGSGTWRSVEVLYDVAGDIKIYVDDVLDVDMNITTSNDTPEVVKLYWADIGNMGVNFDDFVLSQSNAGAASERQGPLRIGGWQNKSDEVAGFGRVGAASNAAAVGDRNGVTGSAPDNDSTYVQSTVPTKDLYVLKPADICTGRDLAVATTLVAKAPSGGTPSIRSICRADPTNPLTTVLGANPLTSSYQTFHGYSAISLRTGGFWTDGEIENALWGVESTGSGIARVTMFTVEKFTSLRNVPYSCGKLGSYAVKKK